MVAHDSPENADTTLQAAMDAIPALVWSARPDGTTEFLNRHWLGFTGLDGDPVSDWMSAVHPDDLPALLIRWQSILASGTSGEMNARLRSYEGTYHHFLHRISPFVDHTGRTTRWYGTSTEEHTYAHNDVEPAHNFNEILGNSPELLKLLKRVDSAAPTDANVLIIGETGSGKELIARAIHDRSARKRSPLVKVNCGAIPAGLVESELFGHIKGAFTSASERRVGRFELANHGTLFLDEVGELPLETQVKLLRVLQEQEFEPVGSNHTIRVNVRIIAATNRDVEKAVQAGTFRSDLYYRLNVIPLQVPALRERKSDIPQLVMAFLRKYAKRTGKPIESVSREAMHLLVNYDWPGNIRELQNVIERGVVLSSSKVLRLGPGLLPVETDEAMPAIADNSDSLEEVQRQHILRVLERTDGVISGPHGAGAILNVHPNTLRSLMGRLGIRSGLQAQPRSLVQR